MLKAVIFDLDGVVADSHPIHEIAWRALLGEAGLDPRTIDVAFLYAGHPRREILKHYLGELSEEEIQHWGRRKDELYELESQNLKAKPGIPRVLSELQMGGIACALATSAGKKRTLESLRHLNLQSSFSVVVAGEDVKRAKPAPDIFLLAAQNLAVSSSDSVVVEDSVAGVQAAVAGGMKCVGFTSQEHCAELYAGGAHDVISNFPEESLRYFQTIASSRAPQKPTEYSLTSPQGR